MCGRFNFTDDQLEEIKNIIYEVTQRVGREVKTGDVYPTDLAAVITRQGADAMRWGFPKWDGKGVLFNARAETALEKKSFRQPLLSRRCVIPTSAYYEWRSLPGGKTKQKYRISNADGGVLYMAGMAQSSAADDDVFTILTTRASAPVSVIHDRQPLLLRAEEVRLWVEESDWFETVLTRPPLAPLPEIA